MKCQPLLLFLLFLFLLVTIHSKRTIRTVAGIPRFGGDGNLATKANLNLPKAVFATMDNEVYIADNANYVIRKVDKTGIISTVVGIPGERSTRFANYDKTPVSTALLKNPSCVYVTQQKEIYVCDGDGIGLNSDTVIQRIVKDTISSVTSVSGSTADGLPAKFTKVNTPSCVFVTEWNGEVFVCDSGNHVIRKMYTNGTMVIVAGVLGDFSFNGAVDALQATLHFPSSVYVTSQNELYIADTNNDLIRRVFLNNGSISTIAGVKYRSSTGDPCLFSLTNLCEPQSIYVVEQTRELFVLEEFSVNSEGWSSAVRRVDLRNGNMSIVAGSNIPSEYTGDYGPATNATFNSPQGMTMTAERELLIADTMNDVIRRVDIQGIITPFAGISAKSDKADVNMRLSSLKSPMSVQIDSTTRDMFILDDQDFVLKKRNSKGHCRPIKYEWIQWR